MFPHSTRILIHPNCHMQRTHSNAHRAEEHVDAEPAATPDVAEHPVLLEHHVGGGKGEHSEPEHEVREGEAHDERVCAAVAQLREQQHRQDDQHVTGHHVHVEDAEHSREHPKVHARCDALEAEVAFGSEQLREGARREVEHLHRHLVHVVVVVLVVSLEGVRQGTHAERV